MLEYYYIEENKKQKMNDINYIFVFGTLMRKYSSTSMLAKGGKAFASKVKDVTIHGYSLYGIYGSFIFPMIKKGDGSVRGELWRLTDVANYRSILLDGLDRYENVASGLYNRSTIEIDGQEAYIYEYTGEIDDNTFKIQSNDWITFCNKNKELIEDYNDTMIGYNFENPDDPDNKSIIKKIMPIINKIKCNS